jgi:hypothetical protein
MKKMFGIMIAFCIVVPVFAANPIVFKSEEVVAVSTNAKLHTLTDSGYLSVFANGGKIYVTEDPAGVSPNTSSKYISAGGELDTGSFYYKGQKFGVLADTGTVSVNFTYRRPLGN